jgi:rhamnosyltransferase
MIVSIIGCRGIPAKYGGFDIFVENISTMLVKKGHVVNVGCERELGKNELYFNGVSLKYSPFVKPKKYILRKIYEVINDIYFMIVFSTKADALYILGAKAGIFTFLPKLINSNIIILVNNGGLEWKRTKWNLLEKTFLRINNIISYIFADIIIIDSESLRTHIVSQFRHKAIFIPYGALIPDRIRWDKNKLEGLLQLCPMVSSIKESSYWLEIARLEPDNNIHVVMEGYLKSNSKKQLVIVGSTTSDKYGKLLGSIAENSNNKILMVGSIYNDKELLEMLRQNCFGYIHAHSFGGTNPSLLEAMASKSVILAHNNAFNREVCDRCAIYFEDSVELGEKIRLIEKEYEKFVALKEDANQRVRNLYSWDGVLKNYIELLDG